MHLAKQSSASDVTLTLSYMQMFFVTVVLNMVKAGDASIGLFAPVQQLTSPNVPYLDTPQITTMMQEWSVVKVSEPHIILFVCIVH